MVKILQVVFKDTLFTPARFVIQPFYRYRKGHGVERGKECEVVGQTGAGIQWCGKGEEVRGRRSSPGERSERPKAEPGWG